MLHVKCISGVVCDKVDENMNTIVTSQGYFLLSMHVKISTYTHRIQGNNVTFHSHHTHQVNNFTTQAELVHEPTTNYLHFCTTLLAAPTYLRALQPHERNFM